MTYPLATPRGPRGAGGCHCCNVGKGKAAPWMGDEVMIGAPLVLLSRLLLSGYSMLPDLNRSVKGETTWKEVGKMPD